MSAATQALASGRFTRRAGTPLEQYRDDGPLAHALGDTAGRRLRVQPLLLALVGLAGLATAMAVEGDGASTGLVAAAVGWLVFWVGASSGRPHTDRFAWALPAVVRSGEYGALVWIGANAGASSLPAAFSLIAVLAFRHYDLVYRSRFQGYPPAAWLDVAALGWDGRLVLLTLLMAAGALPAAAFAIAATLGVVFVAECVTSWRSHGTSTVSLYDDEEDEGD